MKKIKSNLTRGRPLGFDKEAALNQALMLFWQKGFDNTSIHDLTEALGITPPSLYAAFGNKEALFWAAVDLYSSKYAVSISTTLEEKTLPKEAIHHLLRKLAQNYTDGNTPHGCLIVCAINNDLNHSGRVNKILQKMRRASEKVIFEKIKLAIQLKQIPSDTDAKNLSKFFATIIQGMSIQSKDGASKKDLIAVADLAMNVWPSTGDNKEER